MASIIVGLDQLIEEHMTYDGTEYKLFLDAGYPIGINFVIYFFSFGVQLNMIQDCFP